MEAINVIFYLFSLLLLLCTLLAAWLNDRFLTPIFTIMLIIWEIVRVYDTGALGQ